MTAGIRSAVALLACVVAATMAACSHPTVSTSSNSWDPKAAAAYLDYRQAWWMQWPHSARDHDTVCVSCHTGLPYALARPALRSALAEQGSSANERRLIDGVIKRVRLGSDVGPYYGEEVGPYKAAESRGTEAVLNALILASYDAQSGRLTDDSRTAFASMWDLQQKTGDKKGSWAWLQFDLEPWEASDSGYYGATLAVMAVGTAPENYASTPGIQQNLALLREYLNRESASQPTINRIFLLWASTKWPGLLRPEEQQAIVHEILSRQQADGGWRLASLAWKWHGLNFRSVVKRWFRADGSPFEGRSDGVATGLATLVLEEAGVPRDNIQLKRGVSWLLENQNPKEGCWPASSLNKHRDPSSDIGRFMNDAATAYAVLALTENQRPANAVAAIASH